MDSHHTVGRFVANRPVWAATPVEDDKPVVLGATFSRYLYSVPLACIGAIVYGAARGYELPALTRAFWAYFVMGGGTQILATVCMMGLFARCNFSFGFAFTKTTVLMAVPVGWLLFGDTTSVWGFIAIIIGFIGVIVLSDIPSDSGTDFARRVWNPATGLGLAAGLLFALAGVGYRGAVLQMPDVDPVFRALIALACATVLQTSIMAVWMRLWDTGEITRVFRARRIAGLVGITSMIGSTC
jgi:drug/metabolite transporter (DMT)-like permease